MISASLRQECRAHTVVDYERAADDAYAPLGRNDHEWMKHTFGSLKVTVLSINLFVRAH